MPAPDTEKPAVQKSPETLIERVFDGPAAISGPGAFSSVRPYASLEKKHDRETVTAVRSAGREPGKTGNTDGMNETNHSKAEISKEKISGTAKSENEAAAAPEQIPEKLPEDGMRPEKTDKEEDPGSGSSAPELPEEEGQTPREQDKSDFGNEIPKDGVRSAEQKDKSEKVFPDETQIPGPVEMPETGEAEFDEKCAEKPPDDRDGPDPESVYDPELPRYLAILKRAFTQSGEGNALTFTPQELCYLAADPDFNSFYPESAAKFRGMIPDADMPSREPE